MSENECVASLLNAKNNDVLGCEIHDLLGTTLIQLHRRSSMIRLLTVKEPLVCGMTSLFLSKSSPYIRRLSGALFKSWAY